MRRVRSLLVSAAALTAISHAGVDEVRITEYMYDGLVSEFVELTNTGTTAVDLTGWSLDDDSALPGTLPLDVLGMIQPGESVIITDSAPLAFATDWNLTGVAIMQNAIFGLGRNDAIVLFDATGAEHDRLTYGDEDFPGSIRTKFASGSGCELALGEDDIFRWELAVVGDAYGSFAAIGGDVGNPGTFTAVPCQSVFDARINEIRLTQNGTDLQEFVELTGSGSLAGLTYLVLGDDPAGNQGIVESVTSLSAGTIGGSGFFTVAEASFSLGVANLTAPLNFENNDNVTHLLVSDFTGLNGDDLDLDDDGVLDVTPWAQLVDSVAVLDSASGGDRIYSATTVGPDMGVAPGLVFRCVTGWEIGALDPVGTDDTPGADNPCAPPVFDAKLSEIRTDNAGTDFDEYFELTGSGSLERTWYIVIGDSALGGSGVVEMALDLTGSGFGPSGRFVAAEPTFSLGAADLITSLDFENDDNVTHLVVRDFLGMVGDDLDLDDDGVLEITPWLALLDSVALVDNPVAGDRVYSTTTVGPVLTGAPAHAYLCGAADWRAGTVSNFVIDTPGAENPCVHLGANYCSANPNSTGLPARMSASGSVSVSANSFTLECFDMPTISPTNIFNYFVVGTDPGFVPLVIGQGNLCLGGTLGRYVGPGQVTNAGMTGSASVTIDLGDLPTPFIGGQVPGQTYYFQNFYRDINPMITANLSDGMAVTFLP